MCEIEAADAAAGEHCEIFGELGAGVGFSIEELPDGGLLGVIRGGWVAARWTDAAILFFDQVCVTECLVGCVAPEFFADFLVSVFRDGFGKTVADGFDHDRAVVVVRVFEFFGKGIHSVDTGDEGAAGIDLAAVFRCDEITHRVVSVAAVFLLLLTQGVELAEHFAVVAVDFDVVANGVGWP